MLGQAATSIAARAGIQVPAGTRLLVAPVPRQAVPGPYGREKLAPLLSLFTADGADDGIGLCREILGNGGRGHTAIIHTRSERLRVSFARQMPVSRVLVNGPGAHGCIGLGNGLNAVPHARLRDLRPHLHDRQRDVHQPGQHQTNSAPARWRRRLARELMLLGDGHQSK